LTGSAEEKLLRSIYYNPKTGLSGINDLSKKSGLSQKKVKDFLEAQNIYSRHKAIRKTFPTRRVVVKGIDDQWQIDLVEMIPYSKQNDGFKYMLTCIDCFSKYAWAIPMKNKNVDYLWGDEQGDYERHIGEGGAPADHIFYSVKVTNEWLAAITQEQPENPNDVDELEDGTDEDGESYSVTDTPDLLYDPSKGDFTQGVADAVLGKPGPVPGIED